MEQTKTPEIQTLSKLKSPHWVWTENAFCQRCKGKRLCHILSVAEDRHYVVVGKVEQCTHLPEDLGVGGGQDSEFTYCLDCGQIQGRWPLAKTKLEEQEQNDLEKRKIIKPVTSG